MCFTDLRAVGLYPELDDRDVQMISKTRRSYRRRSKLAPLRVHAKERKSRTGT